MGEKKVVGVRFRRAGKVYYFDPADTEVVAGDTVVVETVRGVEAAQVVVPSRMVSESELTQPLRSVLRKATAEDVKQLESNREKEKEALRVCAQKVSEHNLEMNLVGAEYTFDRGKLIIYFTAEGRVDFRHLVRDLSAAFKTRIELRQIGVRDEAKMVGGLGSCGRQLCCCTFLSEFHPVSIKMAKKQDLSLNPTKISGLCGRLMCCLRYECDGYPEQRRAASGGGAAPPEAVEEATAATAATSDGTLDDPEPDRAVEAAPTRPASRADRPATRTGPRNSPGAGTGAAAGGGPPVLRPAASGPAASRPAAEGNPANGQSAVGPGGNGSGRRGRRRRSRGGGTRGGGARGGGPRDGGGKRG